MFGCIGKRNVLQTAVFIVAGLILILCSPTNLRGQSESDKPDQDLPRLTVENKLPRVEAENHIVTGRHENEHVIIVRPAAWKDTIDDWVRYREQQGFVIHQIDALPSAIELRREIIAISAECGDVGFVVLMGDAPKGSAETVTNNATAVGETVEVPMFYQTAEVTREFGSEPLLVTDLPYCDFDGDGIPEAAIGRIPADTSDQLRRYLTRVMTYEMQPEFSQWQSRVEVTAGVGGFGLLADSAIEMATRQFLTSGIPSALDVNVTYASPTSIYCPPPEELSHTVVSNFNRGSLFWIYIGHGYIDTLDYMQIGEQFFNIFNVNQIEEINAEHGWPIAIFLACYTAAIDATEDALTEQMLLRDNGPIAILAGTRVTMPYGMSTIATEMLDEYFQKRTKTFGEIVLNAKRRAVTDPEADSSQFSQRQFLKAIATAMSPAGHDELAERKEHLALLELLGDPLLHLPQAHQISLSVPEKFQSNKIIEITGTSEIDGVVTIELQRPRDRIPKISGRRRGLKLLPENYNDIRAIYSAANDQVLGSTTAIVANGQFQCTLECPGDLSGKYEVVARIHTNSRWAVGSASLRAHRNKKNRNAKKP